MRRTVLAIAALGGAGCALDDGPAEPTWAADVRPILVANCARCHSPPYIGGAPDYVRFDVYDDELATDGSGDVVVLGAASSRLTIAAYTAMELMPPRFPLTERQIDILARWNEAEAPRGAPIPGNRPPELTLEEAPAVDAEGRVLLRYEISDPDGDLVTGLLHAEPAAEGQDPVRITDALFSGRDRVGWNTAGDLPGTYLLVADLDDGSETVRIELGEVEVLP